MTTFTAEDMAFINERGEENKAKVLGSALRIRGMLDKAVISERRQDAEALLEGFMQEVQMAPLIRMTNAFMEDAFERAMDVTMCGDDVSPAEVEVIIGELEWLSARLAAMSTDPKDVRAGFGLK